MIRILVVMDYIVVIRSTNVKERTIKRNAQPYVQLFLILFVELMEKLTATLVDWVSLIA